MEIIVVDNASTDNTIAMIRGEFAQVELIANERNRGFAAANNQGMQLAQGRYIMLLNPDTEMVGDAPITMMDYLTQHPEVGLMGPQLLNPDGTIQSSRRRFPTLATAFVESTVLQRYLSRSPILSRFYFKDRPDSLVQEVDWLVGACLLVRSEVIEQVGIGAIVSRRPTGRLSICQRLKWFITMGRAATKTFPIAIFTSMTASASSSRSTTVKCQA
jgi:hypothetical protein